MSRIGNPYSSADRVIRVIIEIARIVFHAGDRLGCVQLFRRLFGFVPVSLQFRPLRRLLGAGSGFGDFASGFSCGITSSS
jgi:hypothetical protein